MVNCTPSCIGLSVDCWIVDHLSRLGERPLLYSAHLGQQGVLLTPWTSLRHDKERGIQ